MAYRRHARITRPVHALQAQTDTSFCLVIMHDGPILSKLSDETTLSFDFRFSRERHDDYGHSLRAEAIRDCGTDDILLTNDDNDYLPQFFEPMLATARPKALDLVLCDMVHSLERLGGRPVGSYSAFPTRPSPGNCDIGCFIVRAERARQVGFRDRRSTGDATFIADLMAQAPRWGKVEKILFVHN